MAQSTDSGIGANAANSGGKSGADAGKWYDLFSRGARDWLRHDEKVRESVRQHLPQIVAGGELINGGSRTVRVPIRMLEHYHFRLRRPEEAPRPRWFWAMRRTWGAFVRVKTTVGLPFRIASGRCEEASRRTMSPCEDPLARMRPSGE